MNLAEIISLTAILILVVGLLSLAIFLIYQMNFQYRTAWDIYSISLTVESKSHKKFKQTGDIVLKGLTNIRYAEKLDSKKLESIKDYLYYLTYDLFVSDSYIEDVILMMLQSKNITASMITDLYRTFRNPRVRSAILKTDKLSIEERTLLALENS